MTVYISNERKIFFLHNPKAGGSTIRKLISDSSPGRKICPNFSNSPNSDDYRDDNIDYYSTFDLFFGHWGYNIISKIDNNGIIISNFREPANRIYSLYRYWKYNVNLNDLNDLNENDYMCVKFSKIYNFSDFIRLDNKELNLYIKNFHSRQLYCCGWENLDLNDHALDVIKYRIKKMPWFWMTENPEYSMLLFRKAFPQFQHASLGHENVSSGPYAKILDKDLNYLKSLNYWDYQVYAYAWRLQSERVRVFLDQENS